MILVTRGKRETWGYGAELSALRGISFFFLPPLLQAFILSFTGVTAMDELGVCYLRLRRDDTTSGQDTLQLVTY